MAASSPSPYLSEDQNSIFTIWFDHGPDRAIAITLPVLLENVMESLLRTALRRDEGIANEFFRPTGALGNYGAKIRMLYMLGIVDKPILKDVLIIGKIRNRFAHDVVIKTFAEQPIPQWLEEMSTYSILSDIRDREIEKGSPDYQFKTVLKFTMTEELRTPLGYYKNSIKLYANHLRSLLTKIEGFHDFVFNKQAKTPSP